MALTRFSLENYRCFPDRQEVELGLVTVVLGRNNSGKSALVRAPLVFSTGFDGQPDLPLDLERLGEGPPHSRTWSTEGAHTVGFSSDSVLAQGTAEPMSPPQSRTSTSGSPRW